MAEASSDTHLHKQETGWIERRALVRHLRAHVRVNWFGDHGIAHWMRVRANGLMLCRLNGAESLVVELFAFFHDSRRINEHLDRGHGARGAELALQLRGKYFDIPDAGMDKLVLACRTHSDGLSEGDLTVRTCWDADRLDLGRVGITPDPRRMSTPEARRRDVLKKANARSDAWVRRW